MKLVTTLIANTKGEGKAGDDFWVKAETLLYCALIGYIHYEAPVEEQNFSTLIEMINSMEVREDDEEFKNAVDLMFDELKEREPNHFAGRKEINAGGGRHQDRPWLAGVRGLAWSAMRGGGGALPTTSWNWTPWATAGPPCSSL